MSEAPPALGKAEARFGNLPRWRSMLDQGLRYFEIAAVGDIASLW
jgi:hypothetical protein